MKQRKTRKTLAWLLLFSLILGILLPGMGSLKVQAAKKPTLSKKKLTLYVGSSKTLKVKNAKGKVKWTSSKKKIASVSAKGKIKARKAGKTVITAKVQGKKLTCRVTVKPKPPALNKKSAVLAPGGTIQLKLQNASGTVTWKSSNTAVATVTKKGKVTAKADGAANITATFKKKKYVCKIQVQTPAPAPQQSTTLSVAFDQSELSTQETSILISGTIAHDAALASASYQLCDSESQVVQQGSISAADAWSVTVQPAVGTNTFTLKVTDVTGRSASGSLVLVRYSKELTLDSQVVAGDENESADFAGNVTDIQRETAETGSGASDTVKIIIEKDSELAQKLENGTLQIGDTYILPENEDFPNGFSGVLESWGAPSDSSVDSDTYIEVTFKEPELDDIFDGDGCIDFSGGVDPNDPIAFVMVPDGSQVSAISEQGTLISRAADDTYTRNHFPEGMGGFFQPSITVKSGGSTSIKLDMMDVLLFDGDKVKSTNDQIRLSGSIELADITFDGNLQWKDKGISLMPQQIKMDVSYTTKVNVTLKGGASVDFKDIVKSANDDFENKIEKLGLEISGIDMSNRLMLGVIGLNFVAPPTATLKDLSILTGLSMRPKYFVALYLDLTGEISAEVSVAFDYEAYRECGFNVCNTKASNIEGINSSIYTEKKTLAGDYVMGTYEKERKSKTEYGNPEPKVTLEGTVEGEVEIGGGAMCGVMVCGLIPGDFYGGCQAGADFKLDGKAEIIKTTTNKLLGNLDLEISADVKAGFVLGTDFKFSVKIIESFMKNWELGLEYSKSKEYPIFDVKLDYPTYKLEGTVYDLTDKTVNEHPVLANAEIYIYEKDTLDPNVPVTAETLLTSPPDFKGKSGENGTYVIEELGKRDYVVVAWLPGYQYYLQTDLSFSTSDVRQDIYIEPIREKNWLDVCKPYSYTQTYGEYLGDGNGSMLISGVKYDAGFYLDNGSQGTSGSSDALWNLEGKYTSLDVRIGHLDDTNLLNCTLSIYLDGADEPSQTIELNCHDVSRVYTINLNNAQSAKFSLEKTQSDNWAHSSFGFVEGVWHGKNGSEGTVNFKDPLADVDLDGNFMEICPPYTGISCTTYLGDTEDTFTMSGKSYDTGFTLQTQSITNAWGNSAAMFHTNGYFSALNVRIGHVDANYTENAEVYVYLDGEEEPSQTYTINASDVAKVYTIPLNYAKSVKIALQNVHSNWTTESFGFAEGEWIR